MGDEEMEITRVFDAPLERVWKAWIDPKQVAQWWGPDGFTSRVKKLEPKPAGDFDLDMVGPDNGVYPMKAIFSEIKPMERLVFIGGPADKKGGLVMETVNTVTFGEQKGKTRLTVKARVAKIIDPAAKEYLKGQKTGWTQSIERLAEYLATGKVEKKQPHW